ncbi:MAG: hypothetical protein HOV80_12215 [Polyangiaceae bacterium]|nr:hypothetical protein [Polyangiaceae bacterium]
MRAFQGKLTIVLGAILALSAGATCQAGKNGGEGGAGGDEDGAGATGPGTTVAVTTGQGGGSAATFSNSTATGMQPGCEALPDEDFDGDGFSINDGDCNDCDANVNPNAIEVIVDGEGGGGGMMEPADEDCDGEVDNIPEPCDAAIAFDTMDALEGARSIELCHEATPQADWGVVSAQWVRANGTPLTGANVQYGVLADFGSGVPPRAGESLLALSSGAARLPGQAGNCGNFSCSHGAGTPPPGFPQAVPNCALSDIINDDVGLEVTLKAPSNATGYKFDFKFYSFEYAEYVCTLFNDQFIALVNPPPMGSSNGNISFDSMNNPVSVNIAFFDVCAHCNDFALYCDDFTSICPPTPASCCPAGTAELMGNGFLDAFGTTSEDGGGTSWLQTTAPIGPGETFSVRYAIWDVQDMAWDSTAVIDNFQWIANGGTVNVGTTPVPQ